MSITIGVLSVEGDVYENILSAKTAVDDLGIDAEVTKLSDQRTKHGLFDYIAASWKALIGSKASFNLSCSVDGKIKSVKIKVGDKVSEGDLILTLEESKEEKVC